MRGFAFCESVTSVVEALRRDVRLGFEFVENGEFTDYDENNIKVLAEHVKARGRKRVSEEGL